MPDMIFSSPTGQQITVNSPDGSTPSEGELDQLFAKAGETKPQSDFSPPESDPFAETPAGAAPTQSKTNPITDISGDITRGALNSGAGTLDKINGVVKLLKDITHIDLGNQNLTNVSQALRQSASQQPQSENGIISGIGQFVGSVPAALAEFAGTGGGVGFIARSAALSAADEYNKSQTPTSLVKGAVVGGTVGAALNAIPGVIDSTAKMAQKWGETAGKTYFQKVTGATNEEAQTFIDNINKYNLDPKKEAVDYTDAKLKSSEEVSSLRQSNNDIVAQQKEQQNEQYIMSKDASAKAVQDLSRNNDSIIEDLKDMQTQDKINILRSNSENMMAATDAATQKISEATAKQIQNIATSKDALSKDLMSTFDTASKKLEVMQKGVTDNLTMAHATLDKNGLAYVQTPVLQYELDSAISKNSGKFYKMIRSSDGRSVMLSGAEGTRTPAVNGALNLINSVRANLVNDFLKNGKTSLSSIDANQAYLEGAISKGFNGEALPKDLAATLSEIKSAINPSKLYAKYEQELSHLKPLAEANKAYSTQIDGMRNALDLYRDNVDGTINPDKVFKALDRNDSGYLAKLRQADEALPPQDGIFGKVKKAYDNFNFVANSEKATLTKIEKQVSEQRKTLKNKFDDMEQKLSINQRKEMSRIRTGQNYAERDFSNQERQSIADLHFKQKQALAMIKAQKDKELEALQSSIDERLKFLHIQNMARGARANPSGTMRIVQNVGEYHSISGMMALNPAAVLQGLLIKKIASPIGVSNLVKSAINAPSTTGAAKRLANNKILKRIIATKASGR